MKVRNYMSIVEEKEKKTKRKIGDFDEAKDEDAEK
jgi:hypothetical protein